MGRGGMRPLGELEARIIELMWSGRSSATVREIFAELTVVRPLAYTTVMTVMDNLYRKGMLRRERVGRAFCYQPVTTREEYTADLLDSALAASGDRGAALAHFVGRLSAAEADELRAALARTDHPGAGR